MRRYLDLPLIVVVYLSLHSTAAKGALWGTCFGLFSDLLMGTLVGLNGLSKTVIGFLTGLFRLRATAEGVLGRILLLGGAACLDTVVILAILDLLGQPLLDSSLSSTAIRALLTSGVGVFFFRAYDRIKFPPKKFSGKSMAEDDAF